MGKIGIYSTISILAMSTLLGMIILARSLPAHELPPLYIMGTVINLAVLQLLLAITGFVTTVMLIRYAVIVLGGQPLVKKLVRILGFLVYLFLTFLLLIRAVLTYTTYSEIQSLDDSMCTVIFSERVTVMDHHSGVLYVVNKSGGIGTDTGYRWAGGHDSLPHIAKLKWENGVGFIEPWDVLEPTPDRPDQITCP